MRMKFLFLAAYFVASTTAIGLNCTFERTGWDSIIGPTFSCKVQNLNVTKPKEVITKVLNRLPASDETNDKTVSTLLIFEQICEFFPLGLEKFFHDLQGIAIQKSGLKKITKWDLEPFSELRSISLFGNKLKVLENNLFRFNSKLELVSVFSNELQYIFPNILDNLPVMKMVYLNTNPCINEDALDPVKIDKIKCEFAKKCPVSQEMIDYAELEDEKFSTETENQKLQESLEAVTKNLVKTRRQLDRSREGYNFFKSKLEQAEDEEECYTCNFDLKTCSVEKLELLDLIQDLEIVEIKCEIGKELGTASTSVSSCRGHLKILKPNMVLVSVKNTNKEVDITELTITNQQVLFLPQNLTNFFPKLEILKVKNSELIDVSPEIFAGLSELKEIYLSRNKITEIVEFGNLRKLKKLDLSHNRIDTIEPQAFAKLVSLEELKLNDNLLVRINGKKFANNHNLMTLTLHNNKINQIASNFVQNCLKMENLDLSSNECIDSKFPGLSLDEIIEDIEMNCQVDIEIECRFVLNIDYICFVENLDIDSRNVKIVGVSGEHIAGLSENDVKVLDVFNQTMTYFPQMLGQFFPNVQKIFVEHSKLKEINIDAFEGLDTLKELKIKNNKLTEIFDEMLENLTFLEVIDFSHNLIHNLSENAFENFTEIKSIDLSHNQLTSLDVSVIPVKNFIEKFIFSHNKLSEINPQIMKILMSAQIIDFSKNKCIDSKYDSETHNDKKIMEIFGEISFKCYSD